jgi:hypothetical protein
MANKSSGGNFVSVIRVVTTPLSFLVLAMLIASGFLFRIQDQQQVWFLLIFIAVLCLIVLVLAIVKMEALLGEKPWPEYLAIQMASDIYTAVEPQLLNLPVSEREEAWEMLIEVLKSHTESPKGYQKFCELIGKNIRQKSKIGQRFAKAPGLMSDAKEKGGRRELT